MPKLITTRTRIVDLGKPRVVVVGGGFGGMQLAKGLKGLSAQVVLFDKYNHHTFQPLLYQVATSALETSAILYPFRKKFNNQKDFFFRLAEVIHIDPKENTIQTSIGSVKYDILVLATGATTNYFGNEDFAKLSLPMKTIEDAIALRNRIIRNSELALLTEDPVEMNRYMDYVIVGGGPTGVEIAGALAELKKHVFPHDYKELDFRQMDIHLVEAAPRLLGGMSEKSGKKATEYLERLGVNVHLNCKITQYDGLTAHFDSIDPIPTRSMIWAAGVKGNPVPGLDAGAYAAGGRIVVNEFNQVLPHENIYVIGDLAIMPSDQYPKGHPMVAPTAISQAKLLAKNIKRTFEGQPKKPFVYVNKGSMATIGRNLAVAEIKSTHFFGRTAWLIWIFVHLMSLVGFRSRVVTFFSWMISYFSYDKSNRYIIGNNFGRDVDAEKEI